MSALVILPGEGRVALSGFVTFLLPGEATGGSIAVVEHRLEPGVLAGPPHIHQHEDEISYVLEGTIAVQVGERVLHAPAGSLVYKPRGEQHTFWNAGEMPARLLEIISPAGFENYFSELHALVSGSARPDLDEIVALGSRYGLSFDFAAIQPLVEQYGVQLPAM